MLIKGTFIFIQILNRASQVPMCRCFVDEAVKIMCVDVIPTALAAPLQIRITCQIKCYTLCIVQVHLFIGPIR